MIKRAIEAFFSWLSDVPPRVRPGVSEDTLREMIAFHHANPELSRRLIEEEYQKRLTVAVAAGDDERRQRLERY